MMDDPSTYFHAVLWVVLAMVLGSQVVFLARAVLRRPARWEVVVSLLFCVVAPAVLPLLRPFADDGWRFHWADLVLVVIGAALTLGVGGRRRLG